MVPCRGLSHEPWKPLKTETAKATYARELTRLVAFMLRDKKTYHLDLPANIKILIDQVRARSRSFYAMNTPPSSPDEDYRAYGSNIVNLLVGMWTRTWDRDSQNSIGDPTICYLALSTIRKDRSWADAKDVTPKIAHLFYAIRAVFLDFCHYPPPTLSRKGVREMHAMVAPWHCEGPDSTFNSLMFLTHFASS